MSRPKGSKNKPKMNEIVSETSNTVPPVLTVPPVPMCTHPVALPTFIETNGHSCPECTKFLLCRKIKKHLKEKSICEKFENNFPDILELD